MKSYTDIEQSKKLADILLPESADMWYSYYGNSTYNPTIAYEGEQWFLCQIRNSFHTDIPCWSLSALLSVLPNGIVMNKDSQNGKYHFSSMYIGTYVTADNPIDACYDMIIKLNEMNLL